jgi:ABC-2 type transport system permease protein
MTRTLVVKLLRDLRVNLIVVMLVLFFFQLLWANVTQRITTEVLRDLESELRIDADDLQRIVAKVLFKRSGKIVQALMGGETIAFYRVMDLLSVAYVHPLTQVILCVWAIGRAAGALAGEIDRGTMELLLAQPIRRSQIVLAHLYADWITISLLGASMWLGTWCGVWLNGLDAPTVSGAARSVRFLPALLSVAALLFAVSGTTLAISSAGRSRNRVLGIAVLVTLLQFLLNLIGQLWPPLMPYRPLTIFYYYHPQEMILEASWYGNGQLWGYVVVLALVGAAGYAFAWWRFCTRDVPAPL